MDNIFEYPIITPPFKIGLFENMTKEEAQKHFEWFVNQSPLRCELLRKAMEATSKYGDKLDYSRDSLIVLWTWAMPYMKATPWSDEKRLQFYKQAPPWLKTMNISLNDLSAETMGLCVDIGFYFAEIFIRNYPHIKWVIGRKRDKLYNRPYVYGFKWPLVPHDVVTGCAWNVIHETKNKRILLDTFQAWEKDLT